jgi:hypothetical protein
MLNQQPNERIYIPKLEFGGQNYSQVLLKIFVVPGESHVFPNYLAKQLE